MRSASRGLRASAVVARTPLVAGFWLVLVGDVGAGTRDLISEPTAQVTETSALDENRSTEWPWPESLGAVTAAPESHLVLLENERVRVPEV